MNGTEIKTEFLNDVGIVVPTLGTRMNYLVQSLNSIKQAGCKNVILVGPKSLILESSALSGLFSQVVNDPGDGLPNAINIGMASFPSNIKYVGWLGDDDLLTQNSLVNSVKIFQKYQEVVATYGACSYIDKDGNKIFVNKSGNWAGKFMHILPNLIPQPGSLFRRSAFEKVGGVKPTFSLSFDFELFFNLRKIGKLNHISEIQGSFRWHPYSLSVIQRRSAVFQTSKIRRLFLPKPLNLIAIIWEPVIIMGTLLLGSIVKTKMTINQ